MFFVYYYSTKRDSWCKVKFKEREIEKATKEIIDFLATQGEDIQPSFSGIFGHIHDHNDNLVREIYKHGERWYIGTAENKKEPITKEEPKEKTSRQTTLKKYLDKFEDIKVRVPKGTRQKIKDKAERKGMSVNAYIKFLIDKDE